MLWSLIGPSCVHQSHDSRVGHVSQPGHQDVALSRRLAHSRFFPSGGFTGKSLSSSMVLSTGSVINVRVVSCSFSDSNIFQNGLGQTQPIRKLLVLLLALASDSFECKVFLLVSWQSLAMRSHFGTSQWLLGFR